MNHLVEKKISIFVQFVAVVVDNEIHSTNEMQEAARMTNTFSPPCINPDKVFHIKLSKKMQVFQVKLSKKMLVFQVKLSKIWINSAACTHTA